MVKYVTIERFHALFKLFILKLIVSLVCQVSFIVHDGNDGEGATSDLLGSLACMAFVRSRAWGQAGPLCSKQVAMENSPSGLIQPLPLQVFPQNLSHVVS